MRRAQPQVESFRYAPFRYVRRVPGSTVAHVSASLPAISHTVGFPECGSDPGLSSRCLSINEEA